ncbi:MAG TPA: dihydroorotate dehydrogenase [Thermoplasmatales archaeon]|nr:dihydroorotate dehydrogenase [Thermoplasmatales archaeon]
MLEVKIANLKLKNPTILASGIMGESSGSLIRVAKSGAGALVTKSIGSDARIGYPNPTVVELECGILNSMGLPNPGIEEFGKEIEDIKGIDIPIIGSIFGRDKEEFSMLAKRMEEYGLDAIELNLSCPHAKGYGLEIGGDPDLVKSITREVKRNVSIPVFPKISANVRDVVEIGKAVEEGGADGIVAINSVKAMKIDLSTKKPILHNKFGGYSGRGIKPIGVRCVYELASELSIPVIGVGGIETGKDAAEYILAGATAVEIGSAIFYRDVDVFRKVCQELEEWMKDNGYESIEDFRGLALR